jgi:carbon-monoxide dehydrogenase medium subunit
VKSAPFDYRRPESLEEALELMGQHGDEAKPLAGGQSLVPLLAMRLARPALLVDLSQIGELRGVERGPGRLRIGAMTRQAELERTPGLPPIVAAALPHIGHFQIRSRGTVGGSLAHMDPAAEWPALAVLLDAELELVSHRRGPRIVAASEFVVGNLTTALEADELLLAITITGAEGRFGFAEVERRPGDFALVGAAAHRGRVVVFATGATAQRLDVPAGAPSDEIRRLAEAQIEATADIHAGALYRRRVGARLVERVLAQAAA